jgi:hypothetical protein
MAGRGQALTKNIRELIPAAGQEARWPPSGN